MNDPDGMADCWVCGKLIEEDDDITDTNNGLAHDKCLSDWLDDAPGRAADYYHDQRYDR